MSTHLQTWVVFDVSAESYQAYIEDASNPGKANRVAATDPLTRGSLTVTLSDGLLGTGLSTVDISAAVSAARHALGKAPGGPVRELLPGLVEVEHDGRRHTAAVTVRPKLVDVTIAGDLFSFRHEELVP